jgi:hypothetical protein
MLTKTTILVTAVLVGYGVHSWAWSCGLRSTSEILRISSPMLMTLSHGNSRTTCSGMNLTRNCSQVHLLQLWDELWIPHEESKQVFGSPLMIIGFDVDPNAMTISMPLEACSDLLATICDFTNPGQHHPLREFPCLAGWMNWALNAYPLLQPGLSSLYDKISGKTHAHQLIWVSTSLCRELHWFADHMMWLDGVHIMQSREWGQNDADIDLFCDACPISMGFWFPAGNIGFQHACLLTHHLEQFSTTKPGRFCLPSIWLSTISHYNKVCRSQSIQTTQTLLTYSTLFMPDPLTTHSLSEQVILPSHSTSISTSSILWVRRTL